ncbi:MAG: hypothetical protein U5Q44_09860 [Dehalococcoidia bacterium]|nr:hypothetical protein [Dehalococcoidia bacterium]
MAAVLMAGCGALETGLEPRDQLNCEPGALPGAFHQQSEGVFNIEDLASRTGEPGQRKEELEAMGFAGGTMSTWRRSESSVPARKQVDLVCQAAHFEGAEGARAFLEQIAPEETALRAALVAWPPEDAEPLSIDTTTDDADERGYIVHPGDPDSAGMRILFMRDGNTVVAVQLGTTGAVPRGDGLADVLRSFDYPDEDEPCLAESGPARWSLARMLRRHRKSPGRDQCLRRCWSNATRTSPA